MEFECHIFFNEDLFLLLLDLENTYNNFSQQYCYKCLSLEQKIDFFLKLKFFNMMFNFLSSFNFHRFFQSGMYFDFFYKKLSEIFVRNIFIYMAQFFGEKYMIEHWTKKFVTNIVFNTNKFISFTTLSYNWFFYQFIYITLYFLIILDVILYF